MSLKNMDADLLKERWDMIIDDYLGRLADLKERVIKIDKLRNELLLIRDELSSRNIEVDGLTPNPGGSPPP